VVSPCRNATTASEAAGSVLEIINVAGEGFEPQLRLICELPLPCRNEVVQNCADTGVSYARLHMASSPLCAKPLD